MTQADATENVAARLEQATAERDRLRSALVGLVGEDGRADLEQLEAKVRAAWAPSEDKAVTIDAIHALLATLRADDVSVE